jgi:hypothetical protein
VAATRSGWPAWSGLLEAPSERPWAVPSRRQLLEWAWADWIGDERSVEVHTANLRRTLRDPQNPGSMPAPSGVGDAWTGKVGLGRGRRGLAGHPFAAWPLVIVAGSLALAAVTVAPRLFRLHARQAFTVLLPGASVHLDREQRECPSRRARRWSSSVGRPAKFLADLSHEGWQAANSLHLPQQRCGRLVRCTGVARSEGSSSPVPWGRASSCPTGWPT